MNAALIAWINFLANDQDCYRSGTMKQMILHRSIYFLVLCPLIAMADLGWMVLGLMLLGIYLFRRGLFCGPDPAPQPYQRLVVFGLVPGCALETVALLLHAMDPDGARATALRFACVYLGSFGMSLGYMGMVFLFCRYSAGRKCLQPLVAVGQMSLTNYIGSSFLFGLIFYGYGLGLMGQVSLLAAQLIAVLVLALLTAFSVIWLRVFQYGPLEWLWRTLTYLCLLPILRRHESP